MSTVTAVFVIAAYLFAGVSAGFLAVMNRSASSKYLALALLLLLLHFTLLETGVYDLSAGVSKDYPASEFVNGALSIFSDVLLLVRVVLSLASAVFFSLTVFSLGMELKGPEKITPAPQYYHWSDNPYQYR